MRLRIIHTNDLHSHFDEFAKISTLIKQSTKEHTLILDGGDFADFRSIELQGTKGMAAIELLEEVGYDALTIGNNEMFNGIHTLEHMASSSSMPFISNNLVKQDLSYIRGVFPSVIIQKSNLRILITGSSPDMGVFNDGLGLHMHPYKTAIVNEIERNKGKYDLCILLNHVGTFVDDELAKEIPEIDVILSAHDHKLYKEAKIIEGTILNSAGNYGQHVGIVDIEVMDRQVTLLHSETIETKGVEADERILDILKVNKGKAIEVLSQPLYTLSHPLWHDVIEENPLTNLIADGLKEMLKCEIGLMNSGIVNAGLFHDVSNKKLIEICPSPLNPTTFDVLGKDIKHAIEQALDVQICLADGRGPGFRGKFVGRLHVSSNVEIVHYGKRVHDVKLDGRSLEDKRWYSVASSDYLQRGSGYAALANNRNDQYRAEEIRDVIREYANQSEFMEQAFTNRWKLVTPIKI
ncbi:MAG: 5'-nucleotidase C-terminal domain-containing protein [Paenisporosarcina sp.]